MAVFENLWCHGFVRTVLVSPHVALADPETNARRILTAIGEADAQGAGLVLFPELSLTGYSNDDLFLQNALLEATAHAIGEIVAASAAFAPVIAIGAPIAGPDGIYNCALIIHRGRLLGIVPKNFLPNYREYYEKRYFASGAHAPFSELRVAGHTAPFGTGLVFANEDLPDFTLGFEICEDLWGPIPPSTYAAFDGALIIGNLSASPVTIGKTAFREQLIGAQSERCVCAYLYSAAGYGESTTDLAWDGQLSAFELGRLLGRSPRFESAGSRLVVDVDAGRIRQERLRMGTFRDNRALAARVQPVRSAVPFRFAPDVDRPLPLGRMVERFPFAPSDPERLDSDCEEACAIQVHGLRRRVEAAGARKLVIGVSGGLDSTQALLVCVRAFDDMGRDRRDIVGITMPGFGTGAQSKARAFALMQALGVDAREVDIRPLATRMLDDLGHPFARGEPVHDTTFENVQAGLRTDYLFRLANHEKGLVVGTGDLSELALGWCTYGVGDQMSHYNVNASLAKTLIQHLIRWAAREAGQNSEGGSAIADLLRDILDAPISPELTPLAPDGSAQSTEATIGPYELQDFTLYYATRYGFSPAKIAFLALSAWGDREKGAWPPGFGDSARRAYDLPTILRWLRVFATRFYAQSQFKRSAAPNGPKISSGGSLSPRGDWRAPSDAGAAPWLAVIARIETEFVAGSASFPATPET